MAKERFEAELILETKKFDTGVNNAMGGVKKFAASLAAVVATFKIFEAVVKSTEGGNDKWTATVTAGKEAIESLKRSVATLDFSNLISNMSEAYTKGKQFAELFDQLGEVQAFGGISLMGIQQKSNEAREKMLSSTILADKKKFAEEYLSIERSLNEQTKRLAERTYQINKDKWESINKTDADYAASVYKLASDMFINKPGELDKYKRFIESIGKGFTPFDLSDATFEAGGVNKQIAIALFDYYKTFNQFADGGPLDLAKIISELANGINQADERLNAAIRKSGEFKIEKPVETPAGMVAKNSFGKTGFVDVGDVELKKITPQIIDLTAKLADQRDTVASLADTFSSMFSDVNLGFQGMIDGMITGFKRLIMQLMAKAAAIAILSAIFKIPLNGNFGKMLLGGFDFSSLIGGGGGGGISGSTTIPIPSGQAGGMFQFKISNKDLKTAIRR